MSKSATIIHILMGLIMYLSHFKTIVFLFKIMSNLLLMSNYRYCFKGLKILNDKAKYEKYHGYIKYKIFISTKIHTIYTHKTFTF